MYLLQTFHRKRYLNQHVVRNKQNIIFMNMYYIIKTSSFH